MDLLFQDLFMLEPRAAFFPLIGLMVDRTRKDSFVLPCLIYGTRGGFLLSLSVLRV